MSNPILRFLHRLFNTCMDHRCYRRAEVMVPLTGTLYCRKCFEENGFPDSILETREDIDRTVQEWSRETDAGDAVTPEEEAEIKRSMSLGWSLAACVDAAMMVRTGRFTWDTALARTSRADRIVEESRSLRGKLDPESIARRKELERLYRSGEY
jgi:hypothetical protein